MDELVFTKELDNGIYPQKQLAYSYFIADYRMVNRTFEIRPITIGHLLYALCRNYGRVIYWGFLRFLWKVGFIKLDEGEVFSWRRNFRLLRK